MPYISEERQQAIDRSITTEGYVAPQTAGELTYVLTRFADAWIAVEGLSYDAIAGAIAAFECSKLELYRRVAAPYEDSKMEANGDVYSCGPD